MKEIDIIELVSELRALPKECEWVEFKVDNSNADKLGANISAISNSALLAGKASGYIVYGIENDTHKIVGTNFKPKTQTYKNQEIENYITTQLSPRISFCFHNCKIRTQDGEKLVVIIEIKTPLGHPLRFKGVAFIRVGSYTKKLNDHYDKEAMLWKRLNRIVFEKANATSGLSIGEVLNMINYPAVFKMLNLTLPESRDSIVNKLVEEKLIQKKQTQYFITNLGAILFAYDLRQFDFLHRKAPRVIFYKGIDKIQTEQEQEGIRGYAVGFEGLLTFINTRLPRNEEIGKVFRKNVALFPELAIRELVANALIHQDFTITGAGIMIEIFENRIEITSPGKPLIDPDRFIDHSPESRNEMLAKFMRRLNICEERGSGIDKVIAYVEAFQLPAPEFIKGDNYTRVKLYAPKSIRQMSNEDKVRATYQHCVIKYISGDFMTNASLRERFGIEAKNYPQASRIIKLAIKQSLILPYEGSKMYVPFWAI